MTDSTQYPPGAQVVDEHISRDIAGLRSTVETGFDRLDRRMDSMVTKDAHVADINRLDQRVDHINEKVDQGFSEVKKDMALGFAELKQRDTDRDEQFKTREDERDKKYSRRVGWTISAVAIGVSIVTFIITNLPT